MIMEESCYTGGGVLWHRLRLSITRLKKEDVTENNGYDCKKNSRHHMESYATGIQILRTSTPATLPVAVVQMTVPYYDTLTKNNEED